MTHKTHLQALKELLQQKGYQCTGVDKTTPNLEVLLKEDDQKRIWKVLLCPTTHKLAYGTDQENAHFLQLFLQFPYSCLPKQVQSAARLLLLINKSLPFPAFGLSEVEGAIYYRHVLYCKNRAIPTTLVCSLLGMLLLYIDSLSPMIELVASDKKSLHDVLEEMLSIL